MIHTESIHRRNTILLCLIVFYYIIQVSINIVVEGVASVFPLVFIFIGPVAFLYLLIIKKINPVITMYMVIILTYLYFFFLLTDSPYLINFLFMWLGLPLSAIYQNSRVLWLSVSCSILLSLYSVISLRDEIFGSAVGEDSFYFLLFGLFLIGFFLLMMKENRKGEHFKKLAYSDSLTGSANRNMMLEYFETLKKKEESLALLFIDLDSFKQVNDQYGHDLGDRLLQKVTRRIGAEIAESDLLCRVGGDEFIILISDADERLVYSYINKINHALSLPFSIDEVNLYVTASIGKSEIVESKQANLQKMIQQADKEMYMVKSGECCLYQDYKCSL